MPYIELSRGYKTLVDKKWYKILHKYSWYARVEKQRDGVRVSALGRYEGMHVKMHRVIMGVLDTPEIIVDHINGDPLDNRRRNLRLCTPQQNQFNRRKLSGTSSKYRGVSWDKTKRKWRAIICKKKLGRYATEEEAARVYNREARKLFGRFARLNVIEKK